MNSKPYISIICVSYNHSKYIVECLDSIKNQTYKNIELILADDASSDNSVDVFEKWLRENNFPAKKKFHTKNTGLVKTLNECLKLTTGKYIKYLSCDDFLHPKFIEKGLDKLETISDDYGMVFTDCYSVNNSSEITGDSATFWGEKERYNSDPDIFYENIIAENKISAPTVIVKKEVIEKIGGYDDRFMLEDFPTWLKIANQYKIAFIPENLVYYRQHDNNASIVYQKKNDNEVMATRMLFDRNGSQKKRVDRWVFRLIIKLLIGCCSYKLYTDLFKTYTKYPYRNRSLGFCCYFLLSFKNLWYPTSVKVSD